MHDAAAHHDADATHPAEASGDTLAQSGSTPHDHRKPSQGPGSDECICAEFDAPGAMTPGSMSTVPAVLGSVAVVPLPLPRGHLAPVEGEALDAVRPPDLQPPRA